MADKMLATDGKMNRTCYLNNRVTFHGCSLYFFKVAFSTFRFKFGATLRRQAERRDSETRQKASNLAQPIS